MTCSCVSRAARYAGAIGFALLAAGAPARLAAQDNVLDLRLLEINDKGNATYQNFIFAHNFDGGKWMAQTFLLKLPAAGNYSEFGVGVGYRVATLGPVSTYLMAGGAYSSDGNYFEPAVFATSSTGKLTGSMYFQRYAALTDHATSAWLLDPLELQYAVGGPFAIGAALYAYQPVGGEWLTKVGGKLGVNDKLGTSEIRVSHVSTGGAEIQFRRIFVF